MRRLALILVVGLLPAAAPATAAASTHTATAASAVSLSEAWSVPPPAGTGQIVIDKVAAAGSAIYVAGFVGGALEGETSLGEHDVFVAKYDTSGQLLWARQVGSPGLDRTSALVATPTSVHVAGVSYGHDGPPAVGPSSFVARISSGGSVLWQKTELSGLTGHPAYLAPGVDDGVVVHWIGPHVFEPTHERPSIVRRYRPDGSLIWEDTILGCCTNAGFRGAYPEGLSADPGGVTAIGVKVEPSPAWNATFVRRYTWAGQLIWERSIAAEVGDVDSNQVAASSSAIWVIGTSNVPITGAPNTFPEANPFARRYSFAGTAAWTKAIDANVIRPDCSSFLTTGDTAGDDDPATLQGSYLSRLSPDGPALWRWENPGTSTATREYVDIAVAGSRAYAIEILWEGGSTDVRRLVALGSLPPRSDCDTGAPRAGAPSSKLVSGPAITSGRTTVRTTWTATDASSGVASYDAAQSTDGGAWTTVATGLATPKLDRLLATGHAYRFRVRAVDRAGNVGSWAYGSTFRLTGISESNSRVKYTGTWATSTSSVYWGGKAKASSQAEARASLTFTGKSVEVVSRKGPGRGKIKIYVNGVLKATVDLYSHGTYQNQRVVWAGNWSTSATRTITIRVLGTEFRPRIDLDAFVVGS